MTDHDFRDRLDMSHRWADAPWWDEVYTDAFGSGTVSVDLRGDGKHQRLGIDRSLTLTNGKQVYVDEKVREKDWGDFLLERWSDVDARRPGWAQDRQLLTDYIAYAVIPAGVCWLWPVLQLHRAWFKYGQDWVRRAEDPTCHDFRLVTATSVSGDRQWRTESLCLPREVLTGALGSAFTIWFVRDGWEKAA